MCLTDATQSGPLPAVNKCQLPPEAAVPSLELASNCMPPPDWERTVRMGCANDSRRRRRPLASRLGILSDALGTEACVRAEAEVEDGGLERCVSLAGQRFPDRGINRSGTA